MLFSITAPATAAVAADGASTGANQRVGRLRLDTFSSFEDARAIMPEWAGLVARLDGSLYSTPDWCHVWWRHYGADRKLRLITIRAGEELVGVLPFFIDRLPLFAGGTRVAKLVGCDSTVALFEPPVAHDEAADAFALAIRMLMTEDRVDFVHLGPCPGEGAQLDAIRCAAQELADFTQAVRDREAGSHTLFDMPDGFDPYLRTLSKNQRHSYRRNLNKLSRTFKFEVDVAVDGPELEHEFEAFVDMHQAQWQAAGKLGHFGDWPGSHEFALDLVRTLATTGGVRLIRLLADDEVVAYHWCLIEGDTCHSRLTARLTGEQWDQFALGRMGQLKMMEVAANGGAKTVEAGTGRYQYKEKLNGRTLPVYSIALCRRHPVSRLRARIALAYGDLLNLLYYRAWYLRAAPSVKILRRPLWRSWIRSRF